MFGTLLADDKNKSFIGYSSQFQDSVASAEGFQPKEFHSTREKRANVVQSATEYMDREDIFNYEQQQRIIPSDRMISSNNMLDKFLKSNVINAENAQGYLIMQKLGWNWGSGIGPKKLRSITGLNGENQTFEFRPKDDISGGETQIHNYKFYGLGYGVELPELSQTSEKKRKKISMNIRMAGNLDEEEDENEEIQLPRKRSNLGVKFQSKRRKAPVVSPFRILEKDSFGNPPLNGFVISTLNIYDHKTYNEAPDTEVKKEEQTGTENSVFSFMSEAQRNKIAKLTGNDDLPAGSPQLEFIPELPRDTALAILNNRSLPYGGDPAKQARYIEYLQQQAGIKPEIKTEQLPTINRLLELQEFFRVAMVFRPLVGSMANRFVSATKESSNDNDIVKKESNLSKAFSFDIKPWMPTHLLAKRVGVPYIGKKRQKESRDNSIPIQEDSSSFTNHATNIAAVTIYGDSENDEN